MTTMYIGSSRFAVVWPTETGIRAGAHASTATASSHGTRMNTHARPIATSVPATAAAAYAR